MKTLYICSTLEQAKRIAEYNKVNHITNNPDNFIIKESNVYYGAKPIDNYKWLFDEVVNCIDINKITYQQQAHRTLNYLETDQLNAIHMLLGLGSEVGELMDAYKKAIAYGQELDLTNVIEELGDIKFYISNFCTLLNINEDVVGQKNIDKLIARYPDKFSNENAENRDLKKEREILEK